MVTYIYLSAHIIFESHVNGILLCQKWYRYIAAAITAIAFSHAIGSGKV